MNSVIRGKGLFVLVWGLALASISAAGQTVLSNADLTAFSNALFAGGTVTLDFDGTIIVTNPLSIANSVTIDGSGHSVTVSGGGTSEIFTVASNATLLLRTLTIANGLSANASAGAITNAGILTAYNCVFSNNSSQLALTANNLKATGGAIFNAGLLLVSNSSFIQNSVIGGVDGNNGVLPYAGVVPALGGAIHNVGNTSLINCIFSGNSAIGGDGYIQFPNSSTIGGGNGQGGAIFNSGSIILSNSTFVQNFSSGGVGGQGVPGYFVPTGTGGMGGNGCGGALYSAAGSAIIVNSTFVSNSAAGGAGGVGGPGTGFMPPASGDLNGGTGGTGGNGTGGALWLSNAFMLLTNVTFSANSVSVGAAGQGGPGFFISSSAGGGSDGAPGTAGFVFGATTANLSGTLSALNTIFCVQSNSTNFYGPVTDLGYNIASDQNASLTNATSRNGIDPLLGTLGYYGGNTQTIPLLFGSPAINGGDPNAFPPVDQRGRPRPSGPAPDIGAFEYTFPTFGSLSVSDSGAHFVLLGEAGDACVIDVSSNLVDWTTLTTNSFGVTNAIMILDSTAPASGGRYYRARLQ